jgi:uncharacterized membrane protein
MRARSAIIAPRMSGETRRTILGMLVGVALLLLIMLGVTIGAEWLAYAFVPLFIVVFVLSYGFGWRTAVVAVAVAGLAALLSITLG